MWMSLIKHVQALYSPMDLGSPIPDRHPEQLMSGSTVPLLTLRRANAVQTEKLILILFLNYWHIPCISLSMEMEGA